MLFLTPAILVSAIASSAPHVVQNNLHHRLPHGQTHAGLNQWSSAINGAAARSIQMMSDSDDLSKPDAAFVGDELSRTWERAGKGKKRWAPGDATGDAALDTRLLYSAWVLNPLQLRVRKGCSQSTGARLVLGWLNLPFKPVVVSEGGDGGPLPRLEGDGLPGGCLESFGEICSFAAAVAKPVDKRVAPATGREDIAAWLDNPTKAGLEELLRGRTADDDFPCLNQWGLSIDDAMVLPVARIVGSCVGDGDEAEECSLDVMEYIMSGFAKAGFEIEEDE